jgi:hypothetical protein
MEIFVTHVTIVQTEHLDGNEDAAEDKLIHSSELTYEFLTGMHLTYVTMLHAELLNGIEHAVEDKLIGR